MKLPWERDPNDREANYKRPVPAAERYRIAIKVGAVVAAGVAFRFAISDGSHEGAKLVLAVGTAVLVAGITDLTYLRRHELELIFLKSRSQQRLAAIWMIALGVALVVAATLAYAE